ncbi:hypothetical protein B0J13DRAFT_557309 [Dactylonectria estremocensis]|uniref:Prion-inhibition and propagation HeLo domain-containing protein n=1 Tax=Dactylonectria estremocensis TaxID=1079267 RepID=A0A9P9EIH9_9HYPO|nr:hypothetical protein B0J13DRAFT_557309 [Dactylonectria estremocensis]
MVDPVGTVIGLPGLLFTCVQYYQAFLAYANQEKDLKDLSVRVNVEHQVFSNWKAKAMPDDRTVLISEPAVENLTIACLGQIKATFEEFNVIPDKYGSPRQRPFPLEPLISGFKKISWALNTAKTANELWQKLKVYNEALNRLWNLSQASVQRQLLPELDNFNNSKGLQVMEIALRRADIPEYRELAAAVRLRRVALEAREAEASSIQGPDANASMIQFDDNMRLTAADFDPPISFRNRPPPCNTQVKVHCALLEWKVYEANNPSELTKRQYDRLVGSSIRSLANLLSQEPKPTKLRALDCLGFYEHPDPDVNAGVCFAFKNPPNTVTEPIRLTTLLLNGKTKFKHAGVSVGPVFFLGQRFAMALTLASAVYQLHYLGWLHKGIRSHNVLFYLPKDQQNKWKPDPKQLFLTGYEFARPASLPSLSVKPETTVEEAWYQHPAYMDSVLVKYEPSFDLYSLGIVLVEIALWKRAETLAHEGNTDKSRPCIPLEQWQRYVIRYLLPTVKEKMGEVYGEVVRRCIEGDISGSKSNLGADYKDYLKSLDQEIVAKLELCFA